MIYLESGVVELNHPSVIICNNKDKIVSTLTCLSVRSKAAAISIRRGLKHHNKYAVR